MQNADKANRLKAGNTGNVQDVVEAESNLQDMAAMLTLAHRNQEPFLHTAVFIEMIANDPEHLRMLQSEVEAELNCCKISVDHLLLRQKQGFQSVMLFNIFSYMNNELLCAGNTVAAIDELYLYLNNRTAIGYIRACMKRARKKESSLLLASQNVEDFLLPEAAELTKPLFSIPAYQFLFHPGTVDGGKYREALQLEECEYGVVRSCARGNCLFKCGDERYNLLVKTPPHKLRCYGTAGGR